MLNFGADPSLREPVNKKCLIEIVNEEKDASLKTSMLQLLGDSFMQALVQNNLASIRQFIQAGFDFNQQSFLPDQNSYLHWACMYSCESVIRLLLESGANVRAVNKHGATPLHECVVRKGAKDEKLRIIETLLVHKSDALKIRGIGGVFKDLSVLDLAHTKYQTDPELYNYIKEFVSDVSSLNSSVPSSPQNFGQPLQRHPSIGSQASNNFRLNSSIDELNTTRIDADTFHNWFPANDGLLDQAKLNRNEKTSRPLKSLLWPQPQLCSIISENDNDRFYLPNVKTQPIYIYFKPPYTYAYMDLVNKLASAFSGIVFYCIHKPMPNIPYVNVNIDKNLFSQEQAYSIVVTHTRIDINAVDSVSLQYAFFTFMQICKIYSRQSIPALRVS